MNASTQDTLSKLTIAPENKSRRRIGPIALLTLVVAAIAVGVILFSATGKAEKKPIPSPKGTAVAETAEPATPSDVALTVSGYVIPRERIEISPKFQGTVKWIGIKKGDQVKKGDVLVQLEDDEQRARVEELEGEVALAQASLTNALIAYTRQESLSSRNLDSVRALDDAIRDRDTSIARAMIAKGRLTVARIYLDWCTIRAPIDGTILEKLVNPNELVSPQSYGGGRGPSTAFLAMADLADLQVEIDLNEEDTPKVRINQRCRIIPEAYPDKTYGGYVAEIAPEANRSKGTLQVKVQVEKPDAFLTPELSAQVDFLK
jgi:HlyD family secretion protein